MKTHTNIELIADLMDFSKQGAMMHVFVLQALAHYAQNVLLGAVPTQPSLLSQAAWKQCAIEALDALSSHLNDPALLPAAIPTDDTARGQRLRNDAKVLLLEASNLDKLSPFIITHQHNHGESSYICWHASIPTEQEAAKLLEFEYEPELDESLFIESQVRIEELTGADETSCLTRVDADPILVAASSRKSAPATGGWRMIVPVLSTAHIPSENALSDAAAHFGHQLPYAEGAFLYVGNATPDDCNQPPWLSAILAWFRSEFGDQTWIRFDRDGDTIADLPTFNW